MMAFPGGNQLSLSQIQLGRAAHLYCFGDSVLNKVEAVFQRIA